LVGLDGRTTMVKPLMESRREIGNLALGFNLLDGRLFAAARIQCDLLVAELARRQHPLVDEMKKQQARDERRYDCYWGRVAREYRGDTEKCGGRHQHENRVHADDLRAVSGPECERGDSRNDHYRTQCCYHISLRDVVRFRERAVEFQGRPPSRDQNRDKEAQAQDTDSNPMDWRASVRIVVLADDP